VVTHGGKKFEENDENVNSKDQQEISSGILNDRVEEAPHTASTHNTPMSRRIYDNQEGRGIFMAVLMWILNGGK